MSIKTFNIYVQALSSVAQKATANPVIFSACEAEGITADDWEELAGCGSLSQNADSQQHSALQKLRVSQRALETELSLVSHSISNIKIRKKAIHRDLSRRGASPEDLLFVEQLSFAVYAPVGKSTERKPVESTAPDAKALQLSRMASEIAQRPVVAKAFAVRGIDWDALKDLPQRVEAALAQRDNDYDAWREAGAWERAGASQQAQVWDQMRQGVSRVSKQMPAVKALLDYLRDAKERSKTGKKRGPRIATPTSTELSQAAP